MHFILIKNFSRAFNNSLVLKFTNFYKSLKLYKYFIFLHSLRIVISLLFRKKHTLYRKCRVQLVKLSTLGLSRATRNVPCLGSVLSDTIYHYHYL